MGHGNGDRKAHVGKLRILKELVTNQIKINELNCVYDSMLNEPMEENLQMMQNAYNDEIRHRNYPLRESIGLTTIQGDSDREEGGDTHRKVTPLKSSGFGNDQNFGMMMTSNRTGTSHHIRLKSTTLIDNEELSNRKMTNRIQQ